MKAYVGVLTLLLTGCFQGGIQSPNLSQIQNLGNRASNTTENGITSARIDATSKIPQTVSVGSNSLLSGTSVTLPAGALAISTEISIEEAMPVATETAFSQLAIDSSAVKAGTSVAVGSREAIDTKTPMTILLPLPIGYGLTGGVEANLVILYRVAQNVTQRNTIGVIPRSAITLEGRFARFETQFFGAYQVVELSKATPAVEVQVLSPAFTKSTVANRPALQISALSEVALQSGRKVRIYGQNFRSTMVLAMGGKLVQDLKLLSDNVAEFVIPSANAQGRMALAGEQDGVTTSIPAYYLPSAEDLPMITQAPGDVCAGTRYYDRTGAIQSGSKVCVATVLPPMCSATVTTACIASESFPAVEKAQIETHKTKISSSVAIAGISGTLLNCSYDANQNCVAVASFPAVDASRLQPSKIASGVTLAGVAGTMANCTMDNQSGCITTSIFKSVNVNGFTEWDIRYGKTIAGKAGRVEFYRSGARLATFNQQGFTGALGTMIVDNYDSLEDDNSGATPFQYPVGANRALPSLESERPFVVDGTCAVGATCVYKDRLTNLRWYVQGDLKTFEAAALACDTLTKNGLSNWRIPTQKELMTAYVNGIWTVANGVNEDYWTATTASYSTSRGDNFIQSISDGTGDRAPRASGSYRTICVKH